MRALIEERIGQWRQGADQLQARRARLLAELRSVDADIVATQGAIRGAEELLQLLDAQGQPAAQSAPVEQVDVIVEEVVDGAAVG